MKFKLEYAPIDGNYEQTFDTKEDLAKAFKERLCADCLSEITWEENGTEISSNSIGDILSTGCGCEHVITIYDDQGKEIPYDLEWMSILGI